MLVCFQTLFILFWIFSYCVDLKHFCLERGVLYKALKSGILYLSSETDHNNIVTSICWQVHRMAILVSSKLLCVRERIKIQWFWVCSWTNSIFSDFPHVSIACCHKKAHVHIFPFKFLISLGRITWLWIIALCLKMYDDSWLEAWEGEQ